MKYTARLFSSSKNTTLIKYFLSYFIILSILFLGFFLAVRLQLNHIYFKDLKDQTDKRLTNVMLQLDDDLSDVNQVHSLLSNDINLVLSRYKNENWYNYQAAQRMNEYTVSNSFIDTIVYVDNKTDSILSSGKHVYKEDGIYYVYTGTHYLPFPMMQYTDSNKSQLIFLSDETSSLLLYLPYNSNVESYSIFYVISAKDLQTTLETGSFNGITSVCLVTSDNRIVSGIHTDTIRPYLDGLVKEPGCYPIDSDDRPSQRSVPAGAVLQQSHTGSGQPGLPQYLYDTGPAGRLRDHPDPLFHADHLLAPSQAAHKAGGQAPSGPQLCGSDRRRLHHGAVRKEGAAEKTG